MASTVAEPKVRLPARNKTAGYYAIVVKLTSFEMTSNLALLLPNDMKRYEFLLEQILQEKFDTF